MPPLEELKFILVGGLHSDADAIQTNLTERAQIGNIQVIRIRLKCNLGVRRDLKTLAQCGQNQLTSAA